MTFGLTLTFPFTQCFTIMVSSEWSQSLRLMTFAQESDQEILHIFQGGFIFFTILKVRSSPSMQNFDDEDSLLDTESDVKPVFCRALSEIDGECGVKLAKCFTKSDSDQERT